MSPTPPLCSFILSTYHRADDLRVVLSSLMAQTEPDFEVLIADNSLDGEEIQDNIQVISATDSRFKHYLTKRENWCQAANDLLPKATGKFLCFPSDDAYYPPPWLERMLSVQEDIILSDAFCQALSSGWYRRLTAAPKLGETIKGTFLVKRALVHEIFSGPECHAVADTLLLEGLVSRGVKWNKPAGLLWIQN